MATDIDDLIADIGGSTAGTYAQGSNTKAATGVARHRRTASQDPSAGLERETARLLFPSDFFAAGFSGANPVYPSAGDTFTVAGEAEWEVERADVLALGEAYGLDVSRRRQQGGA